MNAQDIIATLKEDEAALKAQGVAHAALFGSRARGDNRSDIDIMFEIAPSRPMGVFEYTGIVQFLEGLFPARVDVSNRAALKAHVRPSAEKTALYAF
jgi:uncharacterized protein